MKNADITLHDTSRGGIDRRGFLRCMGWAGTAVVCSVAGGILTSRALGDVLANPGSIAVAELNFVQISDTHIGFNKPANTNVIGTFQEAITRINALSKAPEFMLHTGDLSHLAQADEFDTVEQMLKTSKASKVFYVPGEHDILSDNGAQYLDRFGKGTQGNGWYSFDQHAHRGLCPRAALGSLCEMGLGHHGWRAGARDAQGFWLRDRSQRAHSP